MSKKALFLIIILIFYFGCLTQSRVSIFLTPDTPQSEGWSYIKEGNTKEAEKFFSSIDEPFEKNLGMGYVMLVSGKPFKAIDYFKKASNYGKSSLLFSGFAQAYELIEDEEKALEFYKLSYDYNPRSPQVKAKIDYLKGKLTEKYLKKFYSEKKEEEKIKIGEKLLFISPELDEVREELIRIIYKKESFKEVVSIYSGFLRTPHPDVRFFYIKSLESLKLYERALKEAEFLFQDFPEKKEYEELYYSLKEKVKELGLPLNIEELKKKKTITREEFAVSIFFKLGDYIDKLKDRPVIIVDVGRDKKSLYLKKLAYKGLIDVGRSHKVHPKQPLKKYELAEVSYRLVKAYGVKIPYKEIKIVDVPRYNLNYRAIRASVILGILELEKGGYFRPVKNVSGRMLFDFLERLSEKLRAVR